MSDGGISGDPGYGTDAPGDDGSTFQGGPEPAASGMTEERAREVLNDLVDQRVAAQFPGGLDRLNERMADVGAQHQRRMESWHAQDPYADEDDYQPDVLDEIDRVLADAVDRRFDAEEEADAADMARAERDYDFDALREQLPLLQDPDIAQTLIMRAIKLCHDWGEPELVEMPEFVDVIKQIALASYEHPWMRAPNSAQARQPEQPADNGAGQYRGHVQLEAASGARPSSSQSVDWGDRIVQAAERLRPKI